jgi:hypothetical protein
MGRIYKVPFKDVIITAQQDLIAVRAGSQKPLIIHGWVISQTTEVGDTQEEGLTLTLVAANSAATAGSGGTTPTIAQKNRLDTIPTFTAAVNNTTMLSSANMILEEPYGWNERSTPFPLFYPPELRPEVLVSEWKALRLATTPADAFSGSGVMFVEEVG